MRKSIIRHYSDDCPRSFYENAHRYYYMLDLPPEMAFKVYCYVLKIKRDDAIKDLANISKKKERSIKKCYNHVTFKYTYPVEDKFEYMKELKIKSWTDTISQQK